MIVWMWQPSGMADDRMLPQMQKTPRPKPERLSGGKPNAGFHLKNEKGGRSRP